MGPHLAVRLPNCFGPREYTVARLSELRAPQPRVRLDLMQEGHGERGEE